MEEVRSPVNLWSYNPDWSSCLLSCNGRLLVMDNRLFWTSWSLSEVAEAHTDPGPLTWVLCSLALTGRTSLVEAPHYEPGVLASLEAGLWMTSL